jgi:hypothetical protein
VTKSPGSRHLPNVTEVHSSTLSSYSRVHNLLNPARCDRTIQVPIRLFFLDTVDRVDSKPAISRSTLSPSRLRTLLFVSFNGFKICTFPTPVADGLKLAMSRAAFEGQPIDTRHGKIIANEESNCRKNSSSDHALIVCMRRRPPLTQWGSRSTAPQTSPPHP